MSSMYGMGMMGMPVATGTVVPKPAKIKTISALECPDCGSIWKSTPYQVEDEPLEHRLMCVDGWTPEFHVWTITYWKGYTKVEEPEEAE